MFLRITSAVIGRRTDCNLLPLGELLLKLNSESPRPSRVGVTDFFSVTTGNSSLGTSLAEGENCGTHAGLDVESRRRLGGVCCGEQRLVVELSSCKA